LLRWQTFLLLWLNSMLQRSWHQVMSAQMRVHIRHSGSMVNSTPWSLT
jgi:hypothetical protein